MRVEARELAGIQIHCDQELEPATVEGKPTCLVSMDVPYPVSEDDQALWGMVPLSARFP
jgi:hypothetical protein